MHYFVKLFCMLFLLSLASCASKKDVLYFQDPDALHSTAIVYQQPNIQVNDILKIDIGSSVTEASLPYNRKFSDQMNAMSVQLMQLQGYVVDASGTVSLPILGKIKLIGLTPTEAEQKITEILKAGLHLQEPSVLVRVLNAKITVLGEVRNPGNIIYTEPFLTIPQALGYAGDLTMNGRRDDILLIREADGKREVMHIDLTQSDWFANPEYLLRQNDILLVNPNYAKVKTAGVLGNLGAVFSSISFLISIILLIQK